MNNRRLCRDDEVLAETAEIFIYLAMIRIMLRRLPTAKGFRDEGAKICQSINPSIRGLTFSQITA